jgi:hypothetical protein
VERALHRVFRRGGERLAAGLETRRATRYRRSAGSRARPAR